MIRVGQNEQQQQPAKDKEEAEVVLTTIKLVTRPGVTCDWGNHCTDPIEHAVCVYKDSDELCLSCVIEPDRHKIHCAGCGKSLGLYMSSACDDDGINIICFDCEKELRQNAHKLETAYQDQCHSSKKAKIDKLLE